MAEAVGLGFDTTFVKRLAEAEERLLKIQKASTDLQNNAVKAFQQVTQQGVIPYVDQLLKQKQTMEAISKIRLGKNSSDEFREMKQQAKDAVKEINKLVNALSKTEAYKSGISGKSAISFANSMIGKKGENKSIDNLRNAITQLETAQKSQNLSTKQGRKNFNDLNKALMKTKAELAKVTGEAKNVGNSLGPLGSKIAAVFSIQAIRNFVNKMVSVRGEFEIMNKAIQVIIGNKEQANRIWDQTVELAVKSPFSIQQLVKNTRQLAAYRIETEKLHDTTRRLADVSAGLGVDMQRLILAFGQVKAASFLRGTELRQFTEAGIPMLEELAKHFTELRGKVVTVDQVFEMISKRQVAFKDVEQVFKNMTSEGGVFFEMQEKMAGTTRGQISNLKDAVALMFNDIGQQSQGWINTVLKTLRTLIENWRYVAAAIKTVVITYAAYQVAGLAASIATGKFTMTMNALVAGENAATLSTNRLTRSIARLGASMKAASASGGWIGLVITLVVSAIAAIVNFVNAQKEAAEEVGRRQEEMEQNIDQLREKNEELIKTVVKLKDAFKEAVDSKNIHDQRIQLQKLIDIANEEYRMKIIVDVDGMTPEELASQMLEVGNKMEQISSTATSISSTIEQSFGEKLFEKSEDVSKAMEDLLTLDANAINELYNNTIDATIKEGETTEDYINRLLEIRAKDNLRYNRYVELYNQSLDDPQKHIKTLTDASGKKYSAYDPTSFFAMDAETQKMIKAFGKMALALDEFKTDIPTLQQEYQEVLESLSIENAQNLNILNESFDLAIRQYAEQKGLSNTFTDMLIEWTNSFYKIDIGGTPKKKLYDWQKRFNDYLAELRKVSEKALIDEFGDDSNMWADSNFNAYGALSTLQLFDEENADLTRKKMKEQIKGLMDEQKAIIEGGLSRTEDEKKMAQIEYDQLNAMYEWFGGSDKGAAKTAKQKLEEQIKLLEEMHKKYLELKKVYGDIRAEQEVRTAYEDTFNEVFKDTGVSFDAYKTFGGFVDAASDAGAKAGTALTEEMQAKIDELTEKGIYIRSADNAAEEFTKSWEQAILKAKDVEGLGKGYTIGYGEYNTYKDTGKAIQKSDVITQEEASERFSRVVLPQYVKGLNAVLDANKDLIFTQEQYNALLDMSYQGGADEVEKLISYARDEELALAHVMQIREKFAKTYGEEEAEKRFGESFVKQLKESENIYERMALLISTMNLTVGGEVRSDMGGMLSRTEARAQLFSGDLDIAKQLTDALVDMEGLDFMTKEGMVAALERLKELAKKAGPEVEKLLSKTISGYEAEIGLKLAQDADEGLRNQVQNLFDRHSLTLELKKLHVSPQVAKDLFDVDFLDSTGLRSEVIDTYTKNLTGETKKAVADELAKGVVGANWALVARELGDGQIDQIKKDIEKIDDIEEKALKDRIKKYIEYSRKSLGEMGDIRRKQIETMTDIEETFAPQADDTEEEDATRLAEKNRALARAAEEANEALSKLSWEEFRKSETFSTLFDDLDLVSDKVLDDVIKRLKDFKEQWKDLPIDQMKEVNDLLNKAERAKNANSNPWADAVRLRGNIKTDGRSLETAQIDSLTAEQEKLALEQELQMIDLINQKRNENLADDQIKLVLEEKYHHLLNAGVDLEDKRGKIVDKIGKQQKKIDSAQARIQDQKDLVKAYQRQEEAMGEIEKMTKDVYDSFKELYEVVSKDGEDAFLIFADAGMDMTTMVLQTIQLQAELNAARQGADAFGLAMNTAMGVIGWIVMAIQLIAKGIKAVIDYNDKLIEQEVEAQTRVLDDAIKKYEELEEAIDEAYSTSQLMAFSRELDNQYNKAIEAQKAIIAARKSAKGSSTVGSEEWEALKDAEAELDELEKRHEETIKDIFSTLTDGILDSVYDAAKEFTDAWYEAFEETGDGLSGLEDNFNEMFLNLVKNQAAMQITGKFAEQWKKDLEEYINEDDTELTKDEAREWAEKVRRTFPELSAALEGYLGAFKDMASETKEGGLSALSKGIQGLTEETAQVLEAYLNSVRMYVATISADTTSQLNEVKAIHRLLDSVTLGGHSRGGVGFKVFMD